MPTLLFNVSTHQQRVREQSTVLSGIKSNSAAHLCWPQSSKSGGQQPFPNTNATGGGSHTPKKEQKKSRQEGGKKIFLQQEAINTPTTAIASVVIVRVHCSLIATDTCTTEVPVALLFGLVLVPVGSVVAVGTAVVASPAPPAPPVALGPIRVALAVPRPGGTVKPALLAHESRASPYVAYQSVRRTAAYTSRIPT